MGPFVEALTDLNHHVALPVIANRLNEAEQDWDAHETSWDFERNPLYEQFLECMEDDLQLQKIK